MAKVTWHKTQLPGVRFRESSTRKHNKRKDKYFAIRFQHEGKRKEIGIGWSSEGWTAQKAYDELLNRKKGKVASSEQSVKIEPTTDNSPAKLITLNKYWNDCYLAYAKRTKKKSWHKEQGHFLNHLSPALGGKVLDAISITDWDKLVSRLMDRKLSERSIEYITGTLRRILRHAHLRGVISQAPPSAKTIGATTPSTNRRNRIILPHEKELLLHTIRELDENAWRVTQFAFLTGCRASEAFKLEWRHITNNYICFEDTKNGSSRIVPISQTLQRLLTAQTHGTPTELVFTKRCSSPYTEAPSSFRTAIRKLKLNEGRGKLDRISFHSIRHTVATELANQLDLRSLMDVMGWKVPAMALRYMHGNEERKLSALEALGL